MAPSDSTLSSSNLNATSNLHNNTVEIISLAGTFLFGCLAFYGCVLTWRHQRWQRHLEESRQRPLSCSLGLDTLPSRQQTAQRGHEPIHETEHGNHADDSIHVPDNQSDSETVVGTDPTSAPSGSSRTAALTPSPDHIDIPYPILFIVGIGNEEMDDTHGEDSSEMNVEPPSVAAIDGVSVTLDVPSQNTVAYTDVANGSINQELFHADTGGAELIEARDFRPIPVAARSDGCPPRFSEGGTPPSGHGEISKATDVVELSTPA